MKAALAVAMLVVCPSCMNDAPAVRASLTQNAQAAPLPGRAWRLRTAAEMTRRYEAKLRDWKITVSVAGGDCRVLLVETPVLMEQAMIDAMHYGSGAYAVHAWSIDEMYRQRDFRGVAYRDGSNTLWTIGKVNAAELAQVCR